MDENKAVASDSAEATIIRGTPPVAELGPRLEAASFAPAVGSASGQTEGSVQRPAEQGESESAEQEEGDPNAQREALGPEDEPAPAISMTNPPPREPPSLSGAKVSASRLYMLLHNATNRASIGEHDLRSAWDDLKHHMGGVV